MGRKVLTVTLIPFLGWLIALGVFSYYSKVLGGTGFPVWAFAFVTLPVCVGSMAICYIVMVARELNHQANKPGVNNQGSLKMER